MYGLRGGGVDKVSRRGEGDAITRGANVVGWQRGRVLHGVGSSNDEGAVVTK